MKSITWVLMGLFSGATIALTTAVLVVPEILEPSATHRRA